jgi:hypothetical protein
MQPPCTLIPKPSAAPPCCCVPLLPLQVSRLHAELRDKADEASALRAQLEVAEADARRLPQLQQHLRDTEWQLLQKQQQHQAQLEQAGAAAAGASAAAGAEAPRRGRGRPRGSGRRQAQQAAAAEGPQVADGKVWGPDILG